AQLRGEAHEHALLWSGQLEPLSVSLLDGTELVVDALFGTGLARPLKGVPLELVQRLRSTGVPVCAVDIPSGIDGATGQVLGEAVRADLTVTFHRKKPGQLLMPGRTYCG